MEKQAIDRLKYLVGIRKEKPIRDILIYCRRTHGGATYTQIAGEFQLTPARVREIAYRTKRRFDRYRSWPDSGQPAPLPKQKPAPYFPFETWKWVDTENGRKVMKRA